MKVRTKNTGERLKKRRMSSLLCKFHLSFHPVLPVRREEKKYTRIKTITTLPPLLYTTKNRTSTSGSVVAIQVFTALLEGLEHIGVLHRVHLFTKQLVDDHFTAEDGETEVGGPDAVSMGNTAVGKNVISIFSFVH